MRHKRIGRKLGVVSKHRRAMFRNMATDLFRHESITTTDTRAKEIRRVAEKMITLAKKGTLQARRQAASFIKDKDVLKKLFGEIAEKHKDRPGGYTRIIKMGFRRGDNAPLSLIEIVQEDYKPKKKKKKKAAPKAAPKNTESKKSTKKESAEELGLIEDAAKAAVVTEAVAEDAAEPKVEVTTEPEAKETGASPEPADEKIQAEAETAEEISVEPEAKEEESSPKPEQSEDENPEVKKEEAEGIEASTEETQNEESQDEEKPSEDKASDESPEEKK